MHGRFVTQSYQTAVRLQAVVQQQERMKSANSCVNRAQPQQPSSPKNELARRERSSAARSANATAAAASRWAAVAAADKAASITSINTAAAAAAEAQNASGSWPNSLELTREAASSTQRQPGKFDAAAAAAGASNSVLGLPTSVRSDDKSDAPVVMGPVRKVRISVLGAMKRSDRKSKLLHYGIATDDEVNIDINLQSFSASQLKYVNLNSVPLPSSVFFVRMSCASKLLRNCFLGGGDLSAFNIASIRARRQRAGKVRDRSPSHLGFLIPFR